MRVCACGCGESFEQASSNHRYVRGHGESLERVRHKQARQAAERKGDPGITVQKLAVRDEGLCYLCGDGVTTENWSIDHLLPRKTCAELGLVWHRWSNISLAHKRCNERKGETLDPRALERWNDFRIRAGLSTLKVEG
jgi:5-methylcytosine-specific restriction endonuclease McrA